MDLAFMAFGAWRAARAAAGSCELTGAIAGQQRTSRILGLRYTGGRSWFTDKNGFFFAIDKAGHILHIGPWRF
jgi:hypothetical protein